MAKAGAKECREKKNCLLFVICLLLGLGTSGLLGEIGLADNPFITAFYLIYIYIYIYIYVYLPTYLSILVCMYTYYIYVYTHTHTHPSLAVLSLWLGWGLNNFLQFNRSV